MRNVLIITSAPPERIEFRVASLLHNKLNNTIYSTSLVSIYVNNKPSKKQFIVCFLLFLKASVVILHSPLSLSLPFILIARLFNKKVLGFVWDVYPWRIVGKSISKTLNIRIIDFFEPFMLKLCSHIIVPTEDFVKSTGLSGAHVIPFWPKETSISNLQTFKAFTQPRSCAFKIVFAGQINATRDIEAAYERLLKIAKFNFEFIIFSDDVLPCSLISRSNVLNYSFVDRATLTHTMSSCDLGLISLSPKFDAPAFPSKVFDYLASDIPSLYYGPLLPAYTSLLECCGIGIDINSRNSLVSGDIELLRINFNSKKEHFLSLVCLSSNSLCSFTDLIDSSG